MAVVDRSAVDRKKHHHDAADLFQKVGGALVGERITRDSGLEAGRRRLLSVAR